MPDPDEPVLEDDLPWKNRRRIEPARTYSGRIVYKRKKHYMSEEDAARILRSVEIPSTDSANWLVKIFNQLFDYLIRALESARHVITIDIITSLWSKAMELLEYLIRISADVGAGTRQTGINLLYRIANAFGIDISIKL